MLQNVTATMAFPRAERKPSSHGAAISITNSIWFSAIREKMRLWRLCIHAECASSRSEINIVSDPGFEMDPNRSMIIDVYHEFITVKSTLDLNLPDSAFPWFVIPFKSW